MEIICWTSLSVYVQEDEILTRLQENSSLSLEGNERPRGQKLVAQFHIIRLVSDQDSNEYTILIEQ